MANQQTEEEYFTKTLNKSDLFVFKSIDNVNYKPHPYVIGARHVAWAADHWNGMLGEAAIEDAEKNGVHCAYNKCRLPYDSHTSDHVLFLQLKRDCTKQEANDFLKNIHDKLKEYKLDGVGFVETPEKYRIKDA